jgi:hypothetical protein
LKVGNKSASQYEALLLLLNFVYRSHREVLVSEIGIDMSRFNTEEIDPQGQSDPCCGSMFESVILLTSAPPRGSFVLKTGERPVVLLSTGIGDTPVLAMLYALASAGSARQVLWVHAGRVRMRPGFKCSWGSKHP